MAKSSAKTKAANKPAPVKKPVGKRVTPPVVEKVADTEIDHEVTQEDLDLNPELVERGVKVGDVIKVPAPVLPVEKAAEEDDTDISEDKMEALQEIMSPYLESYPEEKKFFITEDGQVFLSGFHLDAKAHQKTLNKKQPPYTYHVG